MIALKQEQLKEFDKLAQSIFYDMFGNPVTNEKGWDKVFMKQIIKVVGGYAFKSDLFKDNGIPILRIGNINTGEFRPINMVYWIEDDKLSRYVMHPGDLVLSLTGTVGKDDYGNVCILDNSYDRYYLNQRNAKLEIIGNVEKLYLSRLLKIDEVKAKLTGTSRGVRQANISNKDIENLIIPLPPLALQQQFAEKIQAIEAQKELVKQSIAETQQLLDSRMDYYFD
jgi:type I restriction enzyme S subunit